MKKHKVLSLLAGLLLALGAVSGCTLQRTGQFFLSTLEDYHRVAHPPTGERWILAFVDPFVYVGCVSRGNGYLDNSQHKWIWLLQEPDWATRIRFDYFLNMEPGNRNLEQMRDSQYWKNKFSGTGEP